MGKGNLSIKNRLHVLAPYVLHLVLVIAVAAYVLAGALAIRQLEAIAINRNSSTVLIRKNDNIYLGDDKRNKISLMDQNKNNQLRPKMECMIEMLKQRSNAKICEEGHLDELTDDVYNNCFQEQIYDNRNENKVSRITNVASIGDVDDYFYWSLMDSIVFCFTVITTIGYGNVAPKTMEGRLFVIAYGVLGIPFTMLAIASLGKFLAEILKGITQLMTRFIKTIFCRNSLQKHSKEKEALINDLNNDDKQKVLNDDGDVSENSEERKVEKWGEALVLIVAFFIYIIIGSIVIASYEPEMDFFGAIYFNFVSLTTIGLGDLVPKNEKYLVLTLVYSAVGLALTTIAIEIAAEYLKMLHYFGRKIDNVANVQIWFGGKKLTMKQLVRNLGDYFDLPINEIADLNLDEFVNAAIKVEAGELGTLRCPRPITLDIESIIFVDADESYM